MDLQRTLETYLILAISETTEAFKRETEHFPKILRSSTSDSTRAAEVSGYSFFFHDFFLPLHPALMIEKTDGVALLTPRCP